jgi:hypothetical protein
MTLSTPMTADIAQQNSFAKQVIATFIGNARKCGPPGTGSAKISASRFSTAWGRRS